MHECIAQLCVNFYYGHPGGKEPLARRYREEFRRSVPEHAVAMAATCASKFFPCCFHFPDIAPGISLPR